MAQPIDRYREMLPLYALRALASNEMDEITQAIEEGALPISMVDSTLAASAAVAELLAEGMPAPRKSLKNAIMAAVESDSAPTPPTEREQVFVMESDGEWVEMLPGISIKVLWRDPSSEQITFLARLAPGASYPHHRHRGVEECLVIEGDLGIDGATLGPGEFTVAFEGNIHRRTSTEVGCLLLLRSPMNDEVLGSDDSGT